MIGVFFFFLSLASLASAVPQDPNKTFFTVTTSGRNYLFDQGAGLITDEAGNTLNPPLNLTVNETYTFLCDTSQFHEFAIHVVPASRLESDRFSSSAISGQGATQNASLVWFIEPTTPEVLYYQCERHTTQWAAITLRADAVVPPPPPNANSQSYKSLLIGHVVLMSLGFGLFIPLGALTSSFLPHKAVLWWLPLHATLAVSGLVCILAGFGLIIGFVSLEGGSHFTLGGLSGPTMKAHHVIGAVLVSFVVVQAALGILSDTLWRVRFRRTGAMPLPGPFPEKTHWWLGRFIVLLSVVQIFLGLVEGEVEFGYGAWIYGVYAAWYGILAIVVLLLLYKLRVDLKKAMEKKNLRNRTEASEPLRPAGSGDSTSEPVEHVEGIIEL